MHEDAAMSASVPADKPAQVTLTLKGGRRHTHAVSSHQGDFHAPFTDAQLREKFRDLAADVLTREGVCTMENAIDRCEQLHSVVSLPASSSVTKIPIDLDLSRTLRAGTRPILGFYHLLTTTKVSLPQHYLPRWQMWPKQLHSVSELAGIIKDTKNPIDLDLSRTLRVWH